MDLSPLLPILAAIFVVGAVFAIVKKLVKVAVFLLLAAAVAGVLTGYITPNMFG